MHAPQDHFGNLYEKRLGSWLEAGQGAAVHVSDRAPRGEAIYYISPRWAGTAAQIANWDRTLTIPRSPFRSLCSDVWTLWLIVAGTKWAFQLLENTLGRSEDMGGVCKWAFFAGVAGWANASFITGDRVERALSAELTVEATALAAAVFLTKRFVTYVDLPFSVPFLPYLGRFVNFTPPFPDDVAAEEGRIRDERAAAGEEVTRIYREVGRTVRRQIENASDDKVDALYIDYHGLVNMYRTNKDASLLGAIEDIIKDDDDIARCIRVAARDDFRAAFHVFLGQMVELFDKVVLPIHSVETDKTKQRKAKKAFVVRMQMLLGPVQSNGTDPVSVFVPVKVAAANTETTRAYKRTRVSRAEKPGQDATLNDWFAWAFYLPRELGWNGEVKLKKAPPGPKQATYVTSSTVGDVFSRFAL